MEGLVRRMQDATGSKLGESFRSDSVGLAVRRRTEERRATVEENADTSGKRKRGAARRMANWRWFGGS
jgi:hypothetical protein